MSKMIIPKKIFIDHHINQSLLTIADRIFVYLSEIILMNYV